MNCPQCQNPMIIARATNFGSDYQYCRTCKKELSELEAAAKTIKGKAVFANPGLTLHPRSGYLNLPSAIPQHQGGGLLNAPSKWPNPTSPLPSAQQTRIPQKGDTVEVTRGGYVGTRGTVKHVDPSTQAVAIETSPGYTSTFGFNDVRIDNPPTKPFSVGDAVKVLPSAPGSMSGRIGFLLKSSIDSLGFKWWSVDDGSIGGIIVSESQLELI